MFGIIVALGLNGCSAGYHKNQVQNEGERLTVGVVQKEITIGMSGGDVAAILGSPNIVSTDDKRREVWVYDKIATDVSYSRSSGSVVGLIFGGSGGGLGGVGADSGASSKTQRTLTVIIKFDDEGLVRDFAYHTSRF
ncbi:outer membrane protein assembly factor BamE [Neiella marina]|uniref:Outer membrane protein assembly factor BamE n=2 Tax=Neiella holothuriorum TaxID=2870530 RepID=A0ABS7EK70_9GAMM|nr:outer membrane protein assembly factor BamE [Neiella holothuriorum]